MDFSSYGNSGLLLILMAFFLSNFRQCTFGSISKAFVKSNAVLEHRDLVTALISEVWRRVDVVKHEKYALISFKDCTDGLKKIPNEIEERAQLSIPII